MKEKVSLEEKTLSILGANMGLRLDFYSFTSWWDIIAMFLSAA
jgi:hypothetical protein